MSQKYRRITLGILVALAGYMVLVCMGLQIAMSPKVSESLELQPMTVHEIYVAMIAHGVGAALSAIGALGLRRRQTVGLFAPKLTLLIALAFLIVSIDRIVCVLFPPPSGRDIVFMPHEERGWHHWPKLVGSGSGRRVETNSLGFRSPEIPLEKPPGECRVLFIGDSITFGFCLDREQGYVYRAETLLRKACPGRAIHAINAGVSGYETWQECHLLRHEGMRLDPDVVLLCYCLNDMSALIGEEEGVLNYPKIYFEMPNDSHWSGIVRAIRSTYSKRRAMRISDGLQWGRRDIFQGQNPEIKTWHDVYREPPLPSVSEAWRKSLGQLDEVRAFCEREGLPWVLVFSPIQEQVGPNAAFKRPEQRLRDWAQDKGVHYVDIVQVFEDHMLASGKPLKAYMMDTVHPTALGCQLMAETAVRFLEENDLPPFDVPCED